MDEGSGAAEVFFLFVYFRFVKNNIVAIFVLL